MAESSDTRPSTEELRALDDVPDVIRAHSFELVGRDGNARARIGFSGEDGEVAEIVFLDPFGNPRVGMTCDRDGAGIGFLGNNGLRMMLLSSFTDDGDDVAVSLELTDAQGESQFMVTVSGTGGVTLGGWLGWANERLKDSQTTGDALKLLASEVSGFMRNGDRVVGDESDSDMRKLTDYMYEKGREERQALIEILAASDSAGPVGP